jgi:uncharacterized membrane protein (DUF106 family)
MESQKQLLPEALKAGLIIGAVGIALFVLYYVAGIQPVGILKPILLLILGLAINVIILVILLKKYRSGQEGIINFLDAFLFGLIALVSAGIITTVFNYLFINYFDTDYMKNVLQAQRDWMENYMSGRASEEQITNALDRIDAQAENIGSIGQSLKGLLSSVIFSGIIALIVAAIMKKNPDVFNNTTSGGVI